MKIKLTVLFSGVLLLNGCGVDYFGGGVGTTKETTDEKGRTVVEMTVSSKTKSYACDGKVYDVEAVSSNLTFTGECKELIIDGSSNKIHIEKVGKIKVDGVKNTITYGNGLNGNEPTIENSGLESTVEKK